MGGHVDISTVVTNSGQREATEVVQLYVRDVCASLTRPVRELKQFQRVTLQPGESRTVTFTLHTDELAFWNVEGAWATEPGAFKVGIGGDSRCALSGGFRVAE